LRRRRGKRAFTSAPTSLRDDDEKIQKVKVVFDRSLIKDEERMIVFFPDREKCEVYLKDALETGDLHDPKELE
jgi:hypothetical protein